MVWAGLMVVTGSRYPIIVTVSGGGEYGFQRGTLLVLTNYQKEKIVVGEMVVFKVGGRDIPIVHRVIRLHEAEDGTMKLLTKGDDNDVSDRGLYPPGKLWLERKDIIGRPIVVIPYVGIVSIILGDYPRVKYSVLVYLVYYYRVFRGFRVSLLGIFLFVSFCIY